MNNTQELKLLYSTTKYLESINHPDAYRISKEICEYAKYSENEISEILKRLKCDEPWEYIRGWAEFDDMKLLVNNSTLIPRIETLEIIEIFSTLISPDIKQIVDIGSGTGAIGLALNNRYPDIKTVLIEKYQETLKILGQNNKKYGNRNCSVIQSDLLSEYKINIPTLIVANLPYVSPIDYEMLDNSVKDYEPKTALLAENSGLSLILDLLDSIKKNINVRGCILEIDPKQKSILEKMDLEFNQEFVQDFRGLFRFLKLYR